MADEKKTEQVTVGRPVEVDNVAYGKGTYFVTPTVARKLRARNATASAAETIREEKERTRLAAAQTGDDAQAAAAGGQSSGGGPSTTGVIIGGDAGGGGGSQEPGGQQSGGGAGGGSQPSTSGGSASGIEALRGELPEDFPARDKLAKGNPEAGVQPVTRYEELVRLTREQLDSIPGIGEATVDAIGQRLFADAANLPDGGGSQEPGGQQSGGGAGGAQ